MDQPPRKRKPRRARNQTNRKRTAESAKKGLDPKSFGLDTASATSEDLVLGVVSHLKELEARTRQADINGGGDDGAGHLIVDDTTLTTARLQPALLGYSPDFTEATEVHERFIGPLAVPGSYWLILTFDRILQQPLNTACLQPRNGLIATASASLCELFESTKPELEGRCMSNFFGVLDDDVAVAGVNSNHNSSSSSNGSSNPQQHALLKLDTQLQVLLATPAQGCTSSLFDVLLPCKTKHGRHFFARCRLQIFHSPVANRLAWGTLRIIDIALVDSIKNRSSSNTSNNTMSSLAS